MASLQGGLMVVPAYAQMQRGNDVSFRFEQDANFWYLTGINFPNWWVIIDSQRDKTWLVEPAIEEQRRLFEESLLHDDATSQSGIKDIITQDQALSVLRRYARTRKLVYTIGQPPHHDYFDFILNPASRDMYERLNRLFTSVQDFRPEIAKIRAHKQPIELEWMQSAIDLTIRSLTEIKKNLNMYKYEYEIEAELSRAFRITGADGHAYDPIISAGENTCLPHYFTNNAKMRKGSFVMMDVGARVNNYSADITRTYALGKPTQRMKEVHSAVQEVQRDIITLLEPGLSVEEYQRKSDLLIKKAMLDLKLMKSVEDTTAFRRHFPHMVSHGLGIDVHDSLGRPRMFEEGMVLTVEPGIYIPEEGIGVRIEDDILITKTGHKNMSAKLSTDL